jgi:biopolymer transport protein ExbB/TolQ
LLVAIPALMFYNYFTKAIANLSLELESSAFQVYRDLRQQTRASEAKA